MRAAACLCHVDAASDHSRTRESEQRRDSDAHSFADPIADEHAVAFADGQSHAHERPRDPDSTWARALLRGRRRTHTRARLFAPA